MDTYIFGLKVLDVFSAKALPLQSFCSYIFESVSATYIENPSIIPYNIPPEKLFRLFSTYTRDLLIASHMETLYHRIILYLKAANT